MNQNLFSEQRKHNKVINKLLILGWLIAFLILIEAIIIYLLFVAMDTLKLALTIGFVVFLLCIILCFILYCHYRKTVNREKKQLCANKANIELNINEVYQKFAEIGKIKQIDEITNYLE